MVRILFLLVLIIHGLIHLMGFAKAFQLAELEELTMPISKPMGLLWLAGAVLMLVTGLLFIWKSNYWPIAAFVAFIVSQMLIIQFWQDAKFATVINVIIFVVALFAWAGVQFENKYRKDVQRALAQQTKGQLEILTEADIAHLPEPVQKYIRYTRSIGKPKIEQMRIRFSGEMRSKGEDWFAFTSEQHNFMRAPTRLFFMKAFIKWVPSGGYHAYQGSEARMQIKVLNAMAVVDIQDEELFRTETVTYFNDLCLFAPAALIDERIQWDSIREDSVRATFTNQGVSISAVLTFNEAGQLTNFISDDRTEVNLGKRLRFSTPISDYQTFNSYRLARYGEAVWEYPDGPFTYGKFTVEEVVYN